MFENAKFVGLKTLIREGKSNENNFQSIPSLWEELHTLVPSVTARNNIERFAMITGDLPDSREMSAYYYALVRVREFPSTLRQPLLALDLGGRKIVRFRHRGPPSTVGLTAMQAIQIWLPQSNATLAENSELFIYPSEYDRNDPDGEFDYALFVN